MAKKSKKRKKQQRRHHFVQQTEQTTSHQPLHTNESGDNQVVSHESVATTTTRSPVESATQVQTVQKAAAAQSSPAKVVDQQLAERISYMKRDSRLTAMIAGGIMVGLIILWIVIDHTGLGPHIYKLINFS